MPGRCATLSVWDFVRVQFREPAKRERKMRIASVAAVRRRSIFYPPVCHKPCRLVRDFVIVSRLTRVSKPAPLECGRAKLASPVPIQPLHCAGMPEFSWRPGGTQEDDPRPEEYVAIRLQ